jgi:hypothetical protein
MSTPEGNARRRGWPPGVRPVTLESFDLLGVDKDNRLYWDGKPVESAAGSILPFGRSSER